MYVNFLFEQVKRAIQQTGYLRTKRGYKPIQGLPISEIKLTAPDIEHYLLNNDITAQAPGKQNEKDPKTPNDPLFAKEWYLVSKNEISTLSNGIVSAQLISFKGFDGSFNC